MILDHLWNGMRHFICSYSSWPCSGTWREWNLFYLEPDWITLKIYNIIYYPYLYTICTIFLSRFDTILNFEFCSWDNPREVVSSYLLNFLHFFYHHTVYLVIRADHWFASNKIHHPKLHCSILIYENAYNFIANSTLTLSWLVPVRSCMFLLGNFIILTILVYFK